MVLHSRAMPTVPVTSRSDLIFECLNIAKKIKVGGFDPTPFGFQMVLFKFSLKCKNNIEVYTKFKFQSYKH